MEKRAEEDAKNAKREEEKQKKAAALAAKKAAGVPVGLSDVAVAVIDDSKSVFDQFKNSQAGNADDIVNRLRMRHAAGKASDAPSSVNSELAAKLAMRTTKK
jgi:hypothetical protein